MKNDRWTREQLKLAFHLYCQLPFGKLHSRNTEIVELAQLIGRTPGPGGHPNSPSDGHFKIPQ